MFDENILYERLNSLEKGVKRTDHDIKRLLNSNKNYSERLEWLKRMEVAFESFEPNTWEEWACKLYVGVASEKCGFTTLRKFQQ